MYDKDKILSNFNKSCLVVQSYFCLKIVNINIGGNLYPMKNSKNDHMDGPPYGCLTLFIVSSTWLLIVSFLYYSNFVDINIRENLYPHGWSTYGCLTFTFNFFIYTFYLTSFSLFSIILKFCYVFLCMMYDILLRSSSFS